MATSQSTFDPRVEYRETPEFPGYRFGNDGSAWTCRGCGKHSGKTVKWRRLKGDVADGGHIFYSLSRDDGSRKYKQASHLVLELFVGPKPRPRLLACHNDGNPANNTPGNLRWDTAKANAADRATHGRHRRGSSSASAKITDDDVREIRRLYDDGHGESGAAIGKRFGIAQTTVSKIVNFQTWTHIPRE